jgi:hypothetical protein
MTERNFKEHFWYFCVLHARFISLTSVLPRLIFRKMLETEKCTECEFLGVFAKFRKATSALQYLSLPLSIYIRQLSSHCRFFREILHLRVLRKSVEKICFIKIRKEYRVLYVTTNTHFSSYLAQFSLEWKIFQKNFVEKTETRILYSVTFFFRKSCCLWYNVDKCCRAGQATDDNMRHAHYMLDT